MKAYLLSSWSSTLTHFCWNISHSNEVIFEKKNSAKPKQKKQQLILIVRTKIKNNLFTQEMNKICLHAVFVSRAMNLGPCPTDTQLCWKLSCTKISTNFKKDMKKRKSYLINLCHSSSTVHLHIWKTKFNTEVRISNKNTHNWN